MSMGMASARRILELMQEETLIDINPEGYGERINGCENQNGTVHSKKRRLNTQITKSNVRTGNGYGVKTKTRNPWNAESNLVTKSNKSRYSLTAIL